MVSRALQTISAFLGATRKSATPPQRDVSVTVFIYWCWCSRSLREAQIELRGWVMKGEVSLLARGLVSVAQKISEIAPISGHFSGWVVSRFKSVKKKVTRFLNRFGVSK